MKSVSKAVQQLVYRLYTDQLDNPQFSLASLGNFTRWLHDEKSIELSTEQVRAILATEFPRTLELTNQKLVFPRRAYIVQSLDELW